MGQSLSSQAASQPTPNAALQSAPAALQSAPAAFQSAPAPSPYHSIKIQTLSPPQEYINRYVIRAAKETWKQSKCRCSYNNCTCQILCYNENIENNSCGHSNSFLGAILEAYNNHHDIILAPTDIWLVICFQFSKYVNANSEQLRNQLVSHQGKGTLEVTTPNDLDESQWDEFFSLMIQQIAKNTKNNITASLQSDFSTTTPIENMLSVLTVMDCLKKYFDYSRCIPMCGIANVHFLGTIDDWTHLIEKTKNLKQYDIDTKWAHYIDQIIPILIKFIETYNNTPDVAFWNKIINEKYATQGSGSTSYFSGWILNFFGIYNETESSDIPKYALDVPVTLINKLTNTTKMVNLVGGFGGIHRTTIGTNLAFRPQQSMIVQWDGKKIENESA